jgi:hypothetical protein
LAAAWPATSLWPSTRAGLVARATIARPSVIIIVVIVAASCDRNDQTEPSNAQRRLDTHALFLTGTHFGEALSIVHRHSDASQ